MCGKATFAIAASSSSMNVASVTVIAMNQGLMPVLGTGRLSAVTGVTVSLMAMLSTLDSEETVRSHLFYAKLRKRDQSVPLPVQIGRCNDQGRTDQTANRSKSRSAIQSERLRRHFPLRPHERHRPSKGRHLSSLFEQGRIGNRGFRLRLAKGF